MEYLSHTGNACYYIDPTDFYGKQYDPGNYYNTYANAIIRCAKENNANAREKSEPQDQWADTYKKYSRNSQRVLSELNNQMSWTLRQSLGDIDDICNRVRECLTEMDESDKNYWKMKTQSSPLIADAKIEEGTEAIGDNIVSAITLGPVQTQSENQVRIALDPDQPLPPLNDSENDPKALYHSITSPQQPPQKPPSDKSLLAHKCHNEEDSCSECSRQLVKSKPPTPTKEATLSSAAKKRRTGPKVPPAPEVTETKPLLGFGICMEDGVTKAKAQPDLHQQLVKEYETTDSLLEFQKKMEKAERQKNKTRSIMAEELYVPGRNINKISKNNISAGGKPKRGHLSNTILLPKGGRKTRQGASSEKYTDSLWFSPRRKVATPPASRKMLIVDRKVTRESTKVSLDIKPSLSTVSSGVSSVHSKAVNSSRLVIEKKSDHYRQYLRTAPKWQLNCFDILDEIVPRDLEPIKAEYPRRDFVDGEYKKRVQDSFLYSLVYGTENQHFLDLIHLQTPQIGCASENCEKCATPSSKDGERPASKRATKRPSRKRTTSPGRRSRDQSVLDRLRPFLTDPCTPVRYPTTITVMPVTVSYYAPPIGPGTESATYLYTDSGPVGESDPLKMALTPSQKRLWNAKVQKTPGKALVTFLERRASNENLNFFDDGKSATRASSSGNVSKTRQNPKAAKPRNVRGAPASSNAKKKPGPAAPAAKTPPKARLTSPKSAGDARKDATPKMGNHFGAGIENIIDHLENRIIDVLSDKNQQSPDAFRSIEMEIVDILGKINEVPASKTAKLETICERNTSKSGEISIADEDNSAERHKSKTTSDLLNRQDDGIITLKSSTGTKLEGYNSESLLHSSSDEKCCVTSSCAPQQNNFDLTDQIDSTLRKIEETANKMSSTARQEDQVDLERCHQQVDLYITNIKNAVKGAEQGQGNEKLPQIAEADDEQCKAMSQEFLTPFMQAVKQYREERDVSHSNILAFLDSLTALSSESDKENGCILGHVHYRRLVRLTCAIYVCSEYRTVEKWARIETDFAPLKKIEKSEPAPDAENQTVLLSIYTMVFSFVFLGLCFNYSCQ